MSKILVLGFFLVMCSCWDISSAAFGNKDKVKLKDIDVLTLYSDRYTTGRRSQPIPQLKCMGGTAGCHSFKPQVVQCNNRGTDGYDIQWECKTDMDNAYRFGKIEVVCEGYDHPDDAYILRGSCGLEYTLDLTKEGYAQKQHGQAHHHNYYGDNGYQHQRKHRSWGNWFQTPVNMVKKGTSLFGDVIFLAVIAVVIYVIYRTCIASNSSTHEYTNPPPYSTRAPNPPPYSEYTQHASAPPPPPGYTPHTGAPPPQAGFRQEYMPTGGQTYTDSTSSSSTSQSGGSGGGQGSWWSGFTTGGVLGYLFGNSSNRHDQHYQHRGYGSGWGNSWGSGWGNGWGNGWGSRWGNQGSRGWGSTGHSGGWGSTSGHRSSGSSSSAESSSTGTRTASGFGGTRRR